MTDSLLLDVGALGCGCTDHVLEVMHKSLSEDGGDIFEPHHSPHVMALIEEVSQKGQMSLDGLSSDLKKWLAKAATGEFSPVPTPPELAVWAPQYAHKVLAYLSKKPRAMWSASDYVLLVDYLVHSHFPENYPEQVAQLAVKQAAIMGKVQAVRENLTAVQAGALLAYMQTRPRLDHAAKMADINFSVIDYGMAHCMENVKGYSAALRLKIKKRILDHEKSLRLKNIVPPESLETKLFDDFGEFNKDWRRLALTEVGEMANQGFISSLDVGSKVKRMEMYAGACKFCKKIDGVVATVVDPAKPDKDWEKEIWTGKDNVGRSASPYKRVGGSLVPRPDEELWKLPAGLAHPHCRGTWISIDGPAIDDKFTLWLDGILKPKG